MIPELYYKNTSGFLIVYDISNLRSFKELENWIEDIQKLKFCNFVENLK
jgi:GTPase SAR1 family protein